MHPADALPDNIGVHAPADISHNFASTLPPL